MHNAHEFPVYVLILVLLKNDYMELMFRKFDQSVILKKLSLSSLKNISSSDASE